MWIREGLSHDDGGGALTSRGIVGIAGDLDAAGGTPGIDGDLDDTDGDLDTTDGDLDTADGTLGIARDLGVIRKSTRSNRSNPKHIKMLTPISLVSSGKMANASGNRKKTKKTTRNYARSGSMVLDFERDRTRGPPWW